MCSLVLWKVELARDDIGYLAEVISKQSVEGEAMCSSSQVSPDYL